ncbi:MAG: type I-B CRISPR-associated endonuclease Cas1 [Nitrososphaerota archaeon]|nr:type I-B CRISPR-associated endonuclease Cas1 [Nitrososphaerota archaeon]MDG6978778.1 type I-B CRISPR-associated endonuclease Cas1 [Nitrososphaerota archaeon]
MRDYYITKSGRIRRSENTIELELADGSKRDIPINDIRSIHLFGETDLNTRVLVFLNQHGVPVHVYNWYGYYSGSFYPREKLLSGFLVVKQVQHYLDQQERLAIAKEFVRTAIHNIVQNLNHYEGNGKDVSAFIDKIKDEEATLDGRETIPDVMGVEGRSREVYYSSFGTILREGFEFEKRTKQPPQNMLNCMISFGNSLMYATALSEIYHTQLTPTISYLHEPGERRYSLALDLAEVFKPVIVDRVIFNLINNRIIKEEHFLQELNSCYLNENGRRVFIGEYDKKLNTTLKHARLKRHVSYQRLIRIEAFKLVKHLLGEGPYRGFRSQW